MSTNKLKSVNLYGNDMIGRVNVNWEEQSVNTDNPQIVRKDERFYYIKDHLGTIRSTLDTTGVSVAFYDYYPYGEKKYIREDGGVLNNRFAFTGKEHDRETGYDYFGARYYDPEIGRWLSVDPLADKYPVWSPYNYCLNNPFRFIDPNGMGIIVSGDDNRNVVQSLQQGLSFELRMDNETGLLSAYTAEGIPIGSSDVGQNEMETALLSAILSTSVMTGLQTTTANEINGSYFSTGVMIGSTLDKNLGITWSTNVFNVSHATVLENFGGGTVGNSARHEILEAFYAGQNHPGQAYSNMDNDPFLSSHNYATSLTFNNANIIPNYDLVHRQAKYYNKNTKKFSNLLYKF